MKSTALSTRDALQRLSRRRWLLPLALVPGFGAGASTFLGPNGPFLVWCATYWWLLLLVGFVVFFIGTFVISWYFRCLNCSYRFPLNASDKYTNPKTNPFVHFCAYCGTSLDAIPDWK